MVLSKITVDKSVRYILKNEKTEESDIKPKAIKTGSHPRKQNKIFSKINKKFLENMAASGFAVLKGIMTCYFY